MSGFLKCCQQFCESVNRAVLEAVLSVPGLGAERLTGGWESHPGGASGCAQLVPCRMGHKEQQEPIWVSISGQHHSATVEGMDPACVTITNGADRSKHRRKLIDKPLSTYFWNYLTALR